MSVFTYRMSDFRQFMGCTRQFYLSKTLGLKPKYTSQTVEMSKTADLGTLIHAGLAAWYEGDDPEAGVFVEYERMRVERGFDEDEWNMSNYKYLVQATTVVTRYASWCDRVNPLERDDVLFTEKELTAEIGGCTLVGHVDLGLRNSNTGAAVLLDHKSVSTIGGGPRPGDFQLAFYSLLYQENYGELPYEAGHNLLKRGGDRTKAPYVDRQMIPISPELVDNTRRLVLKLLPRMVLLTEQDSYPNMTGECGWKCRVKDLCDGMDDGSDWAYTAKVDFERRTDA